LKYEDAPDCVAHLYISPEPATNTGLLTQPDSFAFSLSVAADAGGGA
jgi:hypothetical protein